MDFNQAISAHFLWKFKLAAYLAKPDRSLYAETLAAEDLCALDQWIEGEGKKHVDSPEFTKLVEDHARFHAAVREIINKVDAGEKVNNEAALGANSAYAAASNGIVLSLMKLKQAA